MCCGSGVGVGSPAPPAGRGNFLNNFTGNITIGNTKEMSSSRIKFDAAARTNWHLHSAPQLLLVEEGRGRLQELGEPIKDVPAGQPVLTWWEGRTNGRGSEGRGSYVIMDSAYHEIARVWAGNGMAGDLHDFQITPRGTAYILIYQRGRRSS